MLIRKIKYELIVLIAQIDVSSLYASIKSN
jgi:hypothetical protein